MTDDQLSKLWEFARGDTAGANFERWFLAQNDLEEPLGDALHWDLLTSDYRDKDTVWKLRQSLREIIEPLRRCECCTIRNVDAIPMGGDFYFEKVFGSLDRIVEYGPAKWWLYISKCRSCANIWLIAQDERIYDEFYFARIDEAALVNTRSGIWPEQFKTYEAVLSVGRKLSTPPRFLDPMAWSLQCAVEDLIRERPAVSVREIAHLLGVSNANASALMGKAQNPSADNLP